jgi:hypothetical protein
MAERRQVGTGSVTARRSARFTVRVVTADGDRKSLGTYPTRSEAEAILAAALRQMAAGGQLSVGPTIFRAFGERVLDGRQLAGVRDIRTERSRWRVHLSRAPFADDPIANITQSDVNSFLLALSAKGANDRRKRRRLSRPTVQRCAALLRAIFDEAVLAGLRADNPCAALKLLRRFKLDVTATEDKWTVLSPAAPVRRYRSQRG